MLYDLIDGLTKVVEAIIANPSQFVFIAVTALVMVASATLLIRRHYITKIQDLSTTVAALYDIEKVATELLKENNVQEGSKKILRSLAFERGGYSTKVYRSQVLKHAQKDSEQ
ncbi:MULTISPECIES: hypothetical protein [Vibrio harveyi group]|uniref:hypothetical protein n=1 Tax=Vibrio harveyi group TaxID=717610 RepID=UPI0015F420D1|nr:hypothetical protein [Vibrio alginolyticus]EJE4208618.1 hypothetical protein [Vibrio parahaemolyticus]HDM8060737.1 hypothetical protein [Vibrio harveyi]